MKEIKGACAQNSIQAARAHNKN